MTFVLMYLTSKFECVVRRELGYKIRHNYVGIKNFINIKTNTIKIIKSGAPKGNEYFGAFSMQQHQNGLPMPSSYCNYNEHEHEHERTNSSTTATTQGIVHICITSC